MKAEAERWRVNREVVQEGMRKKGQTECRDSHKWREEEGDTLGRSAQYKEKHERAVMPKEAERRRDRKEREVEVSRMCSFPCGLFAC